MKPITNLIAAEDAALRTLLAAEQERAAITDALAAVDTAFRKVGALKWRDLNTITEARRDLANAFVKLTAHAEHVNEEIVHLTEVAAAAYQAVRAEDQT